MIIGRFKHIFEAPITAQECLRSNRTPLENKLDVHPTHTFTNEKKKIDSPACGGTNSVSSVGVAASRSVGVAAGTLSWFGVCNTDQSPNQVLLLLGKESPQMSKDLDI